MREREKEIGEKVGECEREKGKEGGRVRAIEIEIELKRDKES